MMISWERLSATWYITPRIFSYIQQGGHKPGKPGILRDFSEDGKLREFCATSGKIVTNKVF